MKENKKAFPISKRKSWAYFAPDGHIQVRSIAETKKLCQEMICYREWIGDRRCTHKDYEEKGYFIERIWFDVKLRKPNNLTINAPK